jgi:hypothetical protein
MILENCGNEVKGIYMLRVGNIFKKNKRESISNRKVVQDSITKLGGFS